MRVSLYLPCYGNMVRAMDAERILPSTAVALVCALRQTHKQAGSRIELRLDSGEWLSTEVLTPNGWIRSV